MPTKKPPRETPTSRASRAEVEVGSPFWTPREAAAYLRCSHRTLERYRAQGKGPRFFKRSGRVFYDIEEVKRYAAALYRQRSTSDDGGGDP